MPNPLTPTAAPTAPRAAASTVAVQHHMTFREFLSDLNPLQYIPVVGTLYRAVTGDRISETAREAGSLVVSGVTGGPIGVGLNVALFAAEKMTGVDPEKIGTSLLSSIGIGHAPVIPSVAEIPRAAPRPIVPASVAAWSPAQLAAYGVTTTAQGNLRRGSDEGSDVLNSIELASLKASSTQT